jgi:hypothetical protein
MTQVINGHSSIIKPVAKSRSVSLKKINYALFSLLSILGVLYLVSVSDLTVKGFTLQELKSRANSANSEKLANEEKINKLQSYYSLSLRTKGLNMVAVGDIEYLNKEAAALAKK